MRTPTRPRPSALRPAPFALVALAAALAVGPGCARPPPAPVVPSSPSPVAAAPRAQGELTHAAGWVAYPRPAGPPMSLTASDGTGLSLVDLDVKAVVEEPLAFTEMRLAFDNPGDRTLEGTFSITLPSGAALSRFAMLTERGWQEGEVVEKQAARVAYEDFLHRKQDPALLEQAAGNQFSARVFPIPAHGRKELVLSYSQELTGDTAYVVPLAGLPAMETVHVEVGRDDGPLERFERTSFLPDRDFAVDPTKLRQEGGLRSGDLAVVRVHPIAEALADPLGSTLFLVDTSASRALGFEAELSLVAALVGDVASAAGPQTRVVVGAFDQRTDLVFDGAAGAFGPTELAALRQRAALGASDLGSALAWAGERGGAAGPARVVLVSDGVATMGETAADKLGKLAAALGRSGVERVDAVAVGGVRDDATLRHLVTAGLLRDGVVLDGASEPGLIARRLQLATRSGLPVRVEGARFSYPERLDGVQPGDEVLVYAEVASGGPVRVSVGGVAVPTGPLVEVERPLLARAVAQAKIAGLLDRQSREGASPALEKQVVELSTAYRVLSPYTSLLVLETEQDYDRFHIDRRALSDILTVQGGRLAVVRRAGSPLVVATSPNLGAPEPRAPKIAPATSSLAGVDETASRAPAAAPAPSAVRLREESVTPAGILAAPTVEVVDLDSSALRSASVAPVEAEPDLLHRTGGLGSIGHGASGGAGAGSASVTRVVQSPTVRTGAPQVSGRIAPEAVQRVVRQAVGRLRRCYQQGLQSNPTLSGRVVVRFVIDRSGAVTSAADAGSTLGDAAVVACVARAFKTLAFPTAGEGDVTVVYPIAFAPGDDPSVRLSGPSGTPAGPPPERPVAEDPYTGDLQTVMAALARGDKAGALAEATRWHGESPGDVLALVALGEAVEAQGDLSRAARVYGSIIDLFPARADLRRFAGGRLERLKVSEALALAEDTYAKAAANRPDHPSSHRLLAFSLLRAHRYADAFDAARAGAARRYPEDRFPGVPQILREDLGLIAAAWMKAEPARAPGILASLREAGARLEDAPSLRFILTWETDANDVDFHIFDDKGGHAYYQQKHLASGGDLYADVTTGYGPECFTIRKPRAARAALYTLQANYYSRGPMGYGMGKLEIIDHDGHGGLTFEERPYVVMVDHAFVDLGTIRR